MCDLGYLGLPVISRDVFNSTSEGMSELDSVVIKWKDDVKNPNVIDPDEVEIKGADASLYVKDGKFTELFNKRYNAILQLRRSELLSSEMGKLEPRKLKIDLSGEKPERKALLKILLGLREPITEAFRRHIGSYQNGQQVMKKGSKLERDFFELTNRTWCPTIQDPLCNALPNFAPPAPLMYPVSLSQEAAIAQGLLDNPFTVITETPDGKYVEVPNHKSKILGPIMDRMAEQLRLAAKAAKTAGEESAAVYLSQLADAYQSDALYPFVKSDAAWAAMSGAGIYLRIGPDEVECSYNGWSSKACWDLTIGIKDEDSYKSVASYAKELPKLETELAVVIGAPYKPNSNREITTPDFYNIIAGSGDSEGRPGEGSPIGQTLPNWGGENGKSNPKTRTLVYVNKGLEAYNADTMGPYRALLTEDALRYFEPSAFGVTVVDHEIGHNMGPQYSVQLEDGKTIKYYIDTKRAMRIEDIKGHAIALWLIDRNYRNGAYDEKRRNELYTANVVWMFNHMKKFVELARTGDYTSCGIYARIGALAFGYYIEDGALVYDEANKKFDINYDKMPASNERFLRDMSQMYMRHDPEEIDKTFAKYLTGDKLKQLHIDAIYDVAGQFVKTLMFEYDVDFGADRI